MCNYCSINFDFNSSCSWRKHEAWLNWMKQYTSSLISIFNWNCLWKAWISLNYELKLIKPSSSTIFEKKKKLIFGAKTRGCWQPSFSVSLLRNSVFLQHITGNGQDFYVHPVGMLHKSANYFFCCKVKCISSLAA